MRAQLVTGLCLCASSAHAEVAIGASVGAGAQGTATYSALELRLDGSWDFARVGLGVRGVWDNGDFRSREWQSIADAIAIVRDVRIAHEVGETKLGLAAGALAPAYVGRVADGYRVSLDDRWRTGVRGAVRANDYDVSAELDDVLDPAFVAAAMRYQMAPPWGMHASVAIDPRAPAMDGAHAVSAVEAGGHRRFEGDRAQAELGVSVIAELSLGVSGVGFATGTLERAGITWTARADVRAGTGTAGSLFGPLYRIERTAHGGIASMWDRAQAGDLDGAAAGIGIGAAAPAGWLELGARTRPGLGGLLVAGGGAPMGKWVQAAMWAAVGRDDAAGAAELRAAWAKRLFSSLQGARIYRLDEMDPDAVWSVTAWFGICSD